jgi:hypothetical protein
MAQGSFMRDLSKMERDLSFETAMFDIYEPSEQMGELTKMV